MITLVPENYLLIQPNVYFTEKETDPMNQLHSSSHINLDQNQSHLFIQVHHADAFFKEILLVFKLIKSVTTYSKTSQKKQIITL